MIATYKKDPVASLPYAVDWSLWLPTGETLSAVVWTVPAGLTLVSQSNTSTVATVRLSGGTAETVYDVACKITTTPTAYVDERTFRIVCEQR